jgi:proteasome activator subunit 4
MGALDTPSGLDISRATSPGGEWRDANGNVNGIDAQKLSRKFPRTFPYFKYLPYEVEDAAEREQNLNTCIKHLYIAVSAGDFAPGAVHWTREIRGWLSLKFDLPRDARVKLVKLYYELALAPGLDYLVAERFASMFMVLTKYARHLEVLSQSDPLTCTLTGGNTTFDLGKT